MDNKSIKFITIMAGLAAMSNVTFSANKIIVQEDKAAAVRALHKLGGDYSFMISKKMDRPEVPNNVARYKFIQYYKYIPVWDSAIVATKEDIKELTAKNIIAGKFYTDIERDLPFSTLGLKMNEKRALNIAKSTANIKDTTNISNVHTEIFIKIDENNIARLVYVVNFVIDHSIPSRPNMIIDAISGEIIEKWEGISFLGEQNAIGPGGNEKIGKYFFGRDYGPLVVDDGCNMSNPKVDTYDMQFTKTLEILYRFTCPENPGRPINGAYAPINDVHYFSGVVYDMFQDWFRIPPLKTKLKMRVHYGVKFDSAFWDGTQITLGDGDTKFYPLVTAEVVAHEIAHGFTEQNSNLVYTKQSGGINESFSDITGQAMQYFLNKYKPETERNDWLFGESVIKGPRGTALRYFENPTKDGVSIESAADYNDTIGIHASSGIFNHAFFQLSDKQNWGVRKTFEVFVVANQLYWGQGTNFDEGGCGVRNAAYDFGYDVNDVINAFKSVGVNARCGLKAATS